MTDLYEILGFDPEGSDRDLKKLYRDLSKKHHPDVGGDADTFAAIAEAYEVLSDLVKRQEYDETGEFKSARQVDQLANDLLANLFINLIENSTERIFEKDIFSIIERDIKTQIQSDVLKRESIILSNEHIRKVLSRIRRKEDHPALFESLLAAAIAANNKRLKALDDAELMHAAAIEFLKHYEFDIETPEAASYVLNDHRPAGRRTIGHLGSLGL